jgi:hypothetical protein
VIQRDTPTETDAEEKRPRDLKSLTEMEVATNKKGWAKAHPYKFLRFDYRYDLSESAQSCKPNVHP